ncbi:bolA-like protein 3 isoform X2 [Patiria miniata]|uniref:BolA-like protein 3 n=1 Tax=Patiria miniata TaxID=46514 RepID=A0A914B3B2_PATMI|nr:bolA-like protein 3 isoform X2 [Patiria miniata]
MLRRLLNGRLHLISRWRGLSDNLALTEGELQLKGILEARFPKATLIQVQDVSGGCGAMYQVNIESEDFAGKRTLQQHRMVTQALAEEVKQMHGLRISTSVPEKTDTSPR